MFDLTKGMLQWVYLAADVPSFGSAGRAFSDQDVLRAGVNSSPGSFVR